MNSVNTKWTPYIYILEHNPSGYFYIGCRYSRGCSPDDLLVKYFTSSSDVKYLLDKDGIESFNKKTIKTYDVIEIFNRNTLLDDSKSDIIGLYSKEHFNAVRAYVLSQESKILRRLKAKYRWNFFNKTDGTEGQAFYEAMRRKRNA